MKAFLFRTRIVVIGLSLSLAAIGRAQNSQTWIPAYNGLLGKYITSDGVKYRAWKNNPDDMKAIQKVAGGIANEKVATKSRKEQLAFYLNAYNAWILHEALARYPTRSVKDLLFTFFISPRIKVGGEQMSFNHLEKDIIRARFNEPRVHFALNCASRSCPPLNEQAFRADQLDNQLEELAVAFINSKKGVEYMPEKKTAALSAIFNWYKEDFKEAGGPVAFINKRLKPPLPNDTRITYQDYDWSLNEVK
jgi:hypothetical protein